VCSLCLAVVFSVTYGFLKRLEHTGSIIPLRSHPDGRWLIRFVTKLIGKSMSRKHIRHSLHPDAVAAPLNIVLVIAILGFFGVQTTSLAALIAAAGVAIGVARSGLPANIAAVIFLVILQSFTVGDFLVRAA
jgi:small conductance mechanosensitive channel